MPIIVAGCAKPADRFVVRWGRQVLSWMDDGNVVNEYLKMEAKAVETVRLDACICVVSLLLALEQVYLPCLVRGGKP